MSESLSDRLKENKRLYEETKYNLGAFHSATAAASTALNDLTAKCQEETQIREQVIEDLKSEQTVTLTLTMAFLGALFATWFGEAMLAAGEWLWAGIRATIGF